MEDYIEKEVLKRMDEQFTKKVNAEVKRQVDIMQAKQNELIDKEVQRQVRIELLKINKNNSKEGSHSNSKRSSGKKSLLTKSLDANPFATLKNNTENSEPYSSTGQ